MRLSVWVVMALANGMMGSSALAEEWGALRGRFLYEGTPPIPEKIVVDKDVNVCSKHPLVDESLVIGKEGGMANIVVYVRTPKVKVHPDLMTSTPAKVTLDNAGCRFTPHIVALWVSQQVLVLHNSDPVPHNARMQPFGDEGINPLIPAGKSAEHRFGREQRIPISVTCNLHPWMKGYVLPRDNPYVAISANDGVFKLDKLPVGELEMQVWHEKAGYVAIPGWERGRFKLKIAKGGHDLGDITIPASLLKK